MTDLSDLDREQLEEHTRKLESRNKALLEALKQVQGFVEESTKADEELVDKVEDALDKDKPDPTLYDTDSIEQAMAELRSTTEESIKRLQDIGEDDPD